MNDKIFVVTRADTGRPDLRTIAVDTVFKSKSDAADALADLIRDWLDGQAGFIHDDKDIDVTIGDMVLSIHGVGLTT